MPVTGRSRWPLAGTPSTHILKPAAQRFPDAAANEVLCLRMARELGRTVRLHQEDVGQALAEVATFTVAIGNADAHGKNLSLLLPPGGRIQLAPLYDVKSTRQYPDVAGPRGRARVSTELAMFIDGIRQIDAVDTVALRVEATRWHLAEDVDERIDGLLERFEGALEVAADAVPQAPGTLIERLRARARRLRDGSTAGG